MEKITHADAKARGLPRFYTGEPCKRAGHVAERFTSSKTCCDCRKLPRDIPAAQPVDAAPPAYEPEKTLHRDPGTRVSQARIDATIERIFNDGARLQSEAA